MSRYENAIEEIAVAVDRLEGDTSGYDDSRGIIRSNAMNVALQVWLACQHKDEQEALIEERRKNLEQVLKANPGEAKIFFGSHPHQG